MRQSFDDLYWDLVFGREKLGYSTVDETTVMLWATLHNHEVTMEFYKYEIKFHPTIKYIFYRFLIMANIYKPPQEIYQIKRDIKVLSTKSDLHHYRLNKLKE